MYRGTITFKNSKKIREWVQAQGVNLLKRDRIDTSQDGTRFATWQCEMEQSAYRKIDAQWLEFEWSLTLEDK
jgi:hypothetical protein